MFPNIILNCRDVNEATGHEAEAEAEATTHEAEAEAEATTHEAEAEAEAATHEAEAEATTHEAEAETHEAEAMTHETRTRKLEPINQLIKFNVRFIVWRRFRERPQWPQ